MPRLDEIADYVRSKNAGPFWVTIDIFCGDQSRFEQLRRSPSLSVEAIGLIYGIDPERIKTFEAPALNVIKISFPRPVAQGGPGDADSHAGQMFVPLLATEIA
jgi:hypothetical protein